MRWAVLGFSVSFALLGGVMLTLALMDSSSITLAYLGFASVLFLGGIAGAVFVD